MISDKSTLPWESKNSTVVVVGDLILDEYLDGSVNRISPEAPVPVHLVESNSLSAGGAANVARNIQLTGGSCTIAGVCGNDGAADQLKQILKQDGIDVSNVEIDALRPTVRKTRITANHQQLVRIDWEDTKPICSSHQNSLLEKLSLLDMDALILSDYGKGGLPRDFITAIIAMAEAKQVPVIVDPKGKDFSIYAGAYLVTPNYKEACEALGIDQRDNISPETLARKIQSKYKIKNVLVTLGPKGMLGCTSDNSIYSLKAVTREVFDVSGAGDTVVSIMSLAIASGIPFDEAMTLANLAAGRVVEKWGTQPINIAELKTAIQQNLNSQQRFGWSITKRKVSPLAELRSTIIELKKAGKKVVFTNGCFDLLHAGHISYLEEARARGHILVVGVNSDCSVRRLKGESRPIISCDHRMTLLAALECVDFVVSFDDDTPANLISTLIPDVLVKGADYAIEDIVGADTVTQSGGQVERIEFVEQISTSDIVRRVKSGHGISIN